MTNPLITKLERRDRLSDEEKRVLDGAVAQVRTFPPRTDIVQEGSRPAHSCLLLDGFAARYRVLEGGKRQITALHVAGDFVDLHSFLLKTMDHGVLALTACRIALVPHEALRRITDDHPHLTRLLWLSTLIDAAIHREWLATMGRLSAAQNLAHLVCEMFTRLGVVGLTSGRTLRLPLSQPEVGDVLGLSTVHVNRVLQELRGLGLLAWQGDAVAILDWDGLARFAEFDPTYLHLEPEPR